MIHNDRYISLYTWPDPQDVNYGLWVIMMCEYRFILGFKKKNSTSLASDVDNGGEHACVGLGGI